MREHLDATLTARIQSGEAVETTPRPDETDTEYPAYRVRRGDGVDVIEWELRPKPAKRIRDEADAAAGAATVGVLRQWADDARSTVIQQADVLDATQILFDRFATVCDTLADLTET